MMNRSTVVGRVARVVVALVVAVALLPVLARAEVHDNAHLFSQSALEAATTATAQFEQKYKKQFVLETFASVPNDKKDEAAQNRSAFFKSWMSGRAKDLRVNGVYALICMDPKYVEVGAGTETKKKGIFTQSDLDGLRAQLQASLKAQQYDAALSGAVDTVDRAFTANIPGSSPSSGTAVSQPPVERSSGSSNMPAPSRSYPNSVPSSSSNGGFPMGLGALLCLGIGLLIIFTLVKSAFRGNQRGGNFGGGFGGNSGYGGGQGNYPTGGPNYGPGPGYGQGYGGGGGGGGFGRGFLGGLLGGAVGGYAADKFEHRNDGAQSSGGFFGGSSDSGTSGGGFDSGGGSGGSSFDSGPSDNGGGFGDGASGGDFGGGGDSGGGGGDSGGGGGDSGGGF